jgi:hypothetical protein
LTRSGKAARTRKARIGYGVFMLLCSVPPLINSLRNPRVATLHVPDILRIFASGLCFGIGLTLLNVRRIFPDE